MNHANKITGFFNHNNCTTEQTQRSGPSVIIWIPFHWRAPKHYYTARMHINRNIVCVSVCEHVWVCTSAPAWLTVHAIKDLFSLTALDFDLRLTPQFSVMTLDPVCAKKKGVMCSARVHESAHKCVPALTCSWELWQGERRVQNMISSITHGVGDNVCVCVCVCTREWVCVCTSLATNVHCTARASPMITGIHSTQKHWPYRTSCNCNQPLTKLQAKTDRHSKWCDDDERRCKTDREELSTLGKSHHVHCAGLVSKSKTLPVMPNSAGSFKDFPPHLSAYLLLLVKQRGQKQNPLIVRDLKRLRSRNTFEVSDRQRHILQQQMQTRVQLGRSSQLPLALLDPPWPLSLSLSLSLSLFRSLSLSLSLTRDNVIRLCTWLFRCVSWGIWQWWWEGRRERGREGGREEGNRLPQTARSLVQFYNSRVPVISSPTGL